MGVEALLVLIAVITFMVLLHRVYKNLHMRGAPLRYTPGFAIGAWFIPFANFVLPYAVVRDAFKQATGKSTGLVLGWWLTYVLSIVLMMTERSLSAPGVLTADLVPVLNVVGPLQSLVHIAAFGLWALVARGIGNAA
jgi:hypothetical protein